MVTVNITALPYNGNGLGIVLGNMDRNLVKSPGHAQNINIPQQSYSYIAPFPGCSHLQYLQYANIEGRPGRSADTCTSGRQRVDTWGWFMYLTKNLKPYQSKGGRTEH